MQRPDGSFARRSAPSVTIPVGRSRDEIMAVEKRVSASLVDKRPVSRRGPIHSAGMNTSHEELSIYGPRPSTAASTQANCGNTLDLLKFLDGQHEPMHRSAPFQIVVKLVASGRKRLRLQESSKSKVRRKSEAADRDDQHRQTEKPRSRIWSSMSQTTTKKKRPWSGNNAKSQANNTVRHDEQAGSPHRRKWMVSGTRNRKNSKVVEYENRDFLYPGVGKLPSLPVDNEQTAADKNKNKNKNNNHNNHHHHTTSCDNRQSSVVSPRSQEPRTSGDAFWQPETAHDNLNQTVPKNDAERPEDSTAAPLARDSNRLGKEPNSLALDGSGANGVCEVSTTPFFACENSIAVVGGGITSLRDYNNNNENSNKLNDAHGENRHPLKRHAWTEQTTVPGSPSIVRPRFSQLQPKDCHPASNNTSSAPQLPRVPPGLTPALTASGNQTATETKESLPYLPPSDSSHIDLECLPPRSSSKGACRNPSIFTSFTHHRRRSSYSRTRPCPQRPRNPIDTQSLISLFPRPARFTDAAQSAASMSSLGQMQPLHAVSTSMPTRARMASSTGHQRSSSKGSPLAASRLHRETSPDMTTTQAAVPLPPPQTTDTSQRTPAATKTTNLQDHFIFTASGDRQCTERNPGRRLSPRGSLEMKRLRCLGISDPSKMDGTKPLDKMSRAERVFVLRMRDMCLARGGPKKDTQPPLPSEGSTPEEVRRGWELQTQSRKAGHKATEMPIPITPPKVRRNDAPGSPPSIPLPKDPPVPSLRSPSNKIAFSLNQLTGQSPSTISLDAALAHKVDARLSASSSGSTHRSNSHKSWSSRSAPSGNDIPQQHHAANVAHHTPSSRADGPPEKNAIASGSRPLTPLPPPMSDEAHTGISTDCENCVSCSHLRANPSPTNKNRTNTFFYKENRSEPRLNNVPASQSPLRECFPQDNSRPYTPSPSHSSNNNTHSNRTSASNSHNTHTTSSPQSSSTRPRSQDTSTHPQCEARIAFLERQNKMLQAALIAALDVGVTFDADLMRSVTATPPISIASPGSETNNNDTFRHSYASTATTGTTRTTTSAQRLSMDGRRSYIRDQSVERVVNNVARSRSVREAQTPNHQNHGGDRKLVGGGEASRR
ncbi:hypothetical protein EMPG_14205 [Blastomyces silverae]|uniref:Uncharacterized protein n=1 Tax=Blastomyces silverae TaxID=2060906 RepID=A0A0H1BHB6_9EURO|nr:hypothetical protein EMPG_14205 [Blastomyces silverae]